MTMRKYSEFVWEFTWGCFRGAINTAVCFQECLLRDLRLYYNNYNNYYNYYYHNYYKYYNTVEGLSMDTLVSRQLYYNNYYVEGNYLR